MAKKVLTTQDIMALVTAWVDGGMKDEPPKQVKVKDSPNSTKLIIKLPKPGGAPAAETETETETDTDTE